MPKRSDGYISVRNCTDSRTVPVNQIMKVFEKDYDVCTACEGKGYKADSSSDFIIKGITTVKYKDNNLLEKLNESDNLNGEVIKKIIETVVHGRKQCNKCNGFGFVKKSGKKHGRKKEKKSKEE